MKKYTFLVFHKEYDAFLSELRNAGVVHISQKGSGEAEDPQMQELLNRRKELQHVLAQGATDQLLHERQEVEKRLESVKHEAAEAAVWGDFSQEKRNKLAEAGYVMRFFTVPKALYQAGWGSVVGEHNGLIYFVAIDTISPIDDILTEASEVALEKSLSALQADIRGLEGLLAAAQARIEGWQKAEMDNLRAELADVEKKIEWQAVVLNTNKLADDALCLLEGYCPADKAAALNALLDEKHIYYQAVDPIATDDTPIQLKNNKFTQLFEVFTGMYGWPTYGEFDPTPILAPFYLLFFSMCMGDAGYGIALMLFGALVWKKKVNIEMFEGLGPIITVLGCGTTLVGFILGTFFGMPLIEQAWYPEACKSLIVSGKVMGYDAQMVLAICIGVFHICLAMTVKAICYTKRFGWKETISIWGWLLLVVGGISAGIVCMALSLPMEVTKWILIAIAGVSALGIYIFNTPGRNPLINIGAGLWDTYNMATGLLGDVLSYVRLYALGLAGGMLGGAFNNLGLMIMGGSTDGATWQWIPFVMILLLGHVLNLAMSALGAFVHPLRLTFVEYFKNSGYEGKGNLYAPFK